MIYRFSQSEILSFNGELFSAFYLNYVIQIIQSKKIMDGLDHTVLAVPSSK